MISKDEKQEKGCRNRKNSRMELHRFLPEVVVSYFERSLNKSCKKKKKKYICDALRDLVSFARFKKREKHPRRSVNFSKVLVKLTLLHGCFSRF